MTPKEIVQQAIEGHVDAVQALHDYMEEKDSPMTWIWCQLMVDKYKGDEKMEPEEDFVYWVNRLSHKESRMTKPTPEDLQLVLTALKELHNAAEKEMGYTILGTTRYARAIIEARKILDRLGVDHD